MTTTSSMYQPAKLSTSSLSKRNSSLIISPSASGGNATLMVRPERIRVTPAEQEPPTGDVVGVRATVTDLTFQGPVVRLSMAAPDSSPIVAHVGPEQDLPLLRPGDEVHVSWAPGASLVLPGADIPTREDLEDMLDDS
mgnify:CR=1 FL=1